MSTPRTAFLIYGPTAAGKSTYARKLASDKGAIRFAIDEWMHALFSEDRPEKPDLSWVMSRVSRCQSRIWSTCTEILDAGTDVVLEIGLMRECDRDRMKATVEAAGHIAIFCFVDADLDTRWRRVRQRNLEKGATYSFEVTRSMFDAMEQHFERPTVGEIHRSICIPQGGAVG